MTTTTATDLDREIRSLLCGRTTAVCGTITGVDGAKVKIRLRHQYRIGCVVMDLFDPELRKWVAITGRFAYDDTMRHMLSHTADYVIRAGTVIDFDLDGVRASFPATRTA